MAKFKSKGVLVKIGDVSFSAATTIAQLGDGTLDLGERESLLDVTDHGSPGVSEQLDNGFKTPFSYSGEIFWDPADVQHELARAAHSSGASLYCRVILPDAGNAQFDTMVRVRSFSAPTPVKGMLKGSIALEGLGATTFAA